MRKTVWTAMIMMAAVAGSAKSQAATVNFGFQGPDVTYALTLTVEPDPNTGVLPSDPPNSVDPIGAYVITGVSGTFSDAALRITDAAVTGLEPLNRVAPEVTNLLAPASFSLLEVAHGVQGGGHVTAGLHYDNLYYPGGSPQTASDYEPHGGVFDIYGLAFTLDNGDAVNVWSNGVFDGVTDYGVVVTDRIDVPPVPLPAAARLFGAALLILGSVGYGRRLRPAANLI